MLHCYSVPPILSIIYTIGFKGLRFMECSNEIWIFIFGFWGDQAPIFTGYNCCDVFFSPNCSPFARYGGVKILGGWKDEGVRFIFIKFQSFKVTYPPFSKVLMLVVCLFSPKSLWFARYRRFKVIYMSQPNFIFYFGILRWPTPHFQMF